MLQPPATPLTPPAQSTFGGRLPARWVAIDFETTGIWSKHDCVCVIEVGVITYEGDREVAAWSTLVRPRCGVDAFITKLTGITQAAVDAEGLDYDPAGDALATALTAAQLVVAHNWDFDKNGVKWFGIELGADQGTFCTMLALAHDGRKWPRLEEAVTEFGVGVEGTPHRAETDARSAGRLFIEMVRRGY